MATVFYVVGTVVLLAGLAAIGLGTPASALDFGNTLLMIGTNASVGGLLLIALGAVVAQLQRIAENLAFEAERHAQPAFKPAPPEPLPRAQVKSELPPFEPQPFEPRGPAVPPEFPMPQPSVAPKLPNPDELSVRFEDAGRQEPKLAAEPAPDTHQAMPPAPPEPSPSPLPELPKPLPTPEPLKKRASLFDSVWPSRERTSAPPPSESEHPVTEPIGAETEPAAPEHPASPEPEHPAPPPPAPPRAEPKPHTVAILKSGVVDGMGYTLYVDGSIEAELPQGTVRFASIQELRAHLEKGGS